nr:MAG TPA: hypothetical protein [Caudoviricetes sp.]
MSIFFLALFHFFIDTVRFLLYDIAVEVIL